jgi:hypothetical protein
MFLFRSSYFGPYFGLILSMWFTQSFGSLLNLGICKEYSIMARAKAPKNGNSPRSPRKTVLKKTTSKVAPVTPDLEAEIRMRAYLLAEQRGFEPGHEHEDWAIAEQEVLSRYSQQSV